MHKLDQDSLTIPGRYDQVQDVCKFIKTGAKKAGFNEETLFHLQLATDEACTNVIEHAYGEEDMGDLRVEWRIEEKDFVIEIHDQGQPFNPEEIKNPDGPQSDPLDLKVGGLGLYFMRSLMDKVQFQFHGKEGNTLTMKKRLPGEGTE